MSSKRLDRIEALQEQIHALQEKMHERIRDIDVALIVREPGTARAAEAYEGLRRSVATAARERRQHLAQLVEIADAIERGASIDTLRQRCEQWCLEAGLERRSDVVPEWFSVVEGEGPVLEVIAPAWVDSASGQLVKQGTARRVPGEIGKAPAAASTPARAADAPSAPSAPSEPGLAAEDVADDPAEAAATPEPQGRPERAQEQEEPEEPEARDERRDEPDDGDGRDEPETASAPAPAAAQAEAAPAVTAAASPTAGTQEAKA